MLFNGLFDANLYGFAIINVGLNDKTGSCNSQMGYKTKLLKHGEAGQYCKKHVPIGFSGKFQICTSCVKQKIIISYMNNIMEKWTVSAMCQKPCLLFPINLILLG